MPPLLEVQLLRAGAAAPRYMSDGAAGMDLTALLDEPLTIAAEAWAAVPTGIAVAIPAGFEGQVRARSGLSVRHGVTVLNGPGTIDADYRGEVKVLLINHGREPFTVKSGDRVAQLVIAPVARAEVAVVAALGETGRGGGGFGSTGT